MKISAKDYAELVGKLLSIVTYAQKEKSRCKAHSEDSDLNPDGRAYYSGRYDLCCDIIKKWSSEEESC